MGDEPYLMVFHSRSPQGLLVLLDRMVLGKAHLSDQFSASSDLQAVRRTFLELIHINNLVGFVRWLALFLRMNALFQVYPGLKWSDMRRVSRVYRQRRRCEDPMKCWIGAMQAKSVIGQLRHFRLARDKKSLLQRLSFMILTW